MLHDIWAKKYTYSANITQQTVVLRGYAFKKKNSDEVETAECNM